MESMPTVAIVAGVVAGLFGLCVLPIVLAFRAERRKREM